MAHFGTDMSTLMINDLPSLVCEMECWNWNKGDTIAGVIISIYNLMSFLKNDRRKESKCIFTFLWLVQRILNKMVGRSRRNKEVFHADSQPY